MPQDTGLTERRAVTNLKGGVRTPEWVSELGVSMLATPRQGRKRSAAHDFALRTSHRAGRNPGTRMPKGPVAIDRAFHTG